MVSVSEILRKAGISLSPKSSSSSWFLSTPPQRPKPASKRGVYPQQCHSNSEGSENKSTLQDIPWSLHVYCRVNQSGLCCSILGFYCTANCVCTVAKKKIDALAFILKRRPSHLSMCLMHADHQEMNVLCSPLRQPSPVSICYAICKYFSSYIIFSLLL